LVERSVIDMGQGSYIITLPKPWVRYFGIKPGEKLEVISNGELIIRRKKGKRRKKWYKEEQAVLDIIVPPEVGMESEAESA